jgi:hypothetical protein
MAGSMTAPSRMESSVNRGGELPLLVRRGSDGRVCRYFSVALAKRKRGGLRPSCLLRAGSCSERVIGWSASCRCERFDRPAFRRRVAGSAMLASR